MNRENNCKCVVCNVEQALLDSFSTQTARNHFQALASNYPVLNHFSSPLDLVAHLHEHGETTTHDAGSEILHALIHAIAERHFEEIGQQLLLVAFTPAIHKTYCEMCQRFPMLSPDDLAQQAWVAFLESVRSPGMLNQNGQSPRALVNRFRQSLFRWALRENQQLSPLQQGSTDHDEPVPSSFECSVALEKFLQQMRHEGLLSEAEHKLLLKFNWEGFEAKELVGDNAGLTTNAVQMRLKRIIKRLRRAVGESDRRPNGSATVVAPSQPENIFQPMRPFSPGRCAISNSEKGFSPELPRQVPQFETDVAEVTA